MIFKFMKKVAMDSLKELWEMIMGVGGGFLIAFLVFLFLWCVGWCFHWVPFLKFLLLGKSLVYEYIAIGLVVTIPVIIIVLVINYLTNTWKTMMQDRG